MTTTDDTWVRKLAGRFIVLDGPDGSGKSTQLKRLVEACTAARVAHTAVRDPGGTPVGERIREILLDRAHTGMGIRTETLLYMASRAELVERLILPAMAKGDLVIADRFVSSTLAYQGAAGNVPASEIAAAAKMATRGLIPDLIIIFDIDEAGAAARLSSSLDRMEAKGREFHRKVRQGYLDQAKADPLRYICIDAKGTEDQVWKQLGAAINERIDSIPPRPPPPPLPPRTPAGR